VGGRRLFSPKNQKNKPKTKQKPIAHYTLHACAAVIVVRAVLLVVVAVTAKTNSSSNFSRRAVCPP
jgi:hypothetical protein